MTKFAICTRTDPTTCFETSNAHILRGRCGLSLYLLNTKASKAKPPNAACTIRANGPSSLHSPFGGGSCGDPVAVAIALDSVSVAVGTVGAIVAIAKAVADVRMVGTALLSIEVAVAAATAGGGSMKRTAYM